MAKKIYKVPFEAPFDIKYHYIKAENREVILANRKNLQDVFKGDGLVIGNINRYKLMWELGDKEPFEYEL